MSWKNVLKKIGGGFKVAAPFVLDRFVPGAGGLLGGIINSKQGAAGGSVGSNMVQDIIEAIGGAEEQLPGQDQGPLRKMLVTMTVKFAERRYLGDIELSPEDLAKLEKFRSATIDGQVATLNYGEFIHELHERPVPTA